MRGQHNIEQLNQFEATFDFFGATVFKNEFHLGGHFFDTIEEYVDVIRINTGVTRPGKLDLFSCMFKATLTPEQSPYNVETVIWFARTATTDMHAYRALTPDREYLGNDVAHLEIPIREGQINFCIGSTASMMKIYLMKDIIDDTVEFIDQLDALVFQLLGSSELG